jgi:ribosome-binding protein aMBF1 (putative translation factor)
MTTNKLFRECLEQVSETTKAEFDLSFAIADRIDFLLKKKGMTQRMLAQKLGKKESEISKWLTGRHNFTTNTLARLALALGEEVVVVP